MTRKGAALGTVVFVFVVPGVVAGVIPFLLTGWHVNQWWQPVRYLGALLIVSGAAVLFDAFVRFAVEGVGTPAPVAPTERLVVRGPYRYVRNPMYLAVAAVIVGQALALGQLSLFAYAGLFGVVVLAFVRGYEEPALTKRFGADYERYRRTVPGWWPRLRRNRE